MAIVYPHRLTFLARGKCDVCTGKGKELVHTYGNRYFGWETCNADSCNEIIRGWYDKTTIPNRLLLQRFGDNIRIQRSSGEIEPGWVVFGDAHLEDANGPFWVKVKNEGLHMSKEVTVNSLTLWNDPPVEKEIGFES